MEYASMCWSGQGHKELVKLNAEADLSPRSLAAFCFVTGIVLVFVKYPFIGMIVETFGFLNLFGWVLLRFLIFGVR